MTPDTTFPATTGVTGNAVANEETLTDTKGGQSRGKNSEKITKDIYVIKNDINNMVYVGQSKETAKRFLLHTYNRAGDTPIDRAIHEFGKEHFYYEILESDIENYNERETYWIKKLNSLYPNGYNMRLGGPQGSIGIEHYTSKIKSQEILDDIVDRIQHTDEPIADIAREYELEPYILYGLCAGESYYNKELKYPLRISCVKYSNEQINNIKYSLEFETEKSMSQIAKENSVGIMGVYDINKGHKHRDENRSYPIRRNQPYKANVVDNLDEIYRLLQTTNLTAAQIGDKFGISDDYINEINRGVVWHRDGFQYPLRDNHRSQRNNGKFNAKQISEIEAALRDKSLSIRDIANMFNCATATIGQINNGTILQYHKDNIKYPIRDGRKYRVGRKNKKSQN